MSSPVMSLHLVLTVYQCHWRVMLPFGGGAPDLARPIWRRICVSWHPHESRVSKRRSEQGGPCNSFQLSMVFIVPATLCEFRKCKRCHLHCRHIFKRLLKIHNFHAVISHFHKKVAYEICTRATPANMRLRAEEKRT